MHFQTNTQIIPINDTADVVLEMLSPITNLEVKTDYALSFNMPVTPEIQQEFGFSNIPSTAKKISKVPVHLFDDNLIYSGNLVAQKSGPRYYDFQIEGTPGNIAPELYKAKITTLDFGKDTIPTTIINSPFYRIATKEPISLNGSTATNRSLSEMFGVNNSTVKIYIDNTEVFSYAFAYSASSYNGDYGGTDSRLEKFVTGYNNNTNSFNSTIEATADEWIITVPSGNHTVYVSITFRQPSSVDRQDRIRTNVYPFTLKFNATRYTYPTIGTYFDNSLLSTWIKPYYLPPLYVPNLYGDANGSFNGTANYLNGSNYVYNTPEKPNENTFIPVFKFQYIVTKLMEILGYTLDQTWFNLPENQFLCWNTLVCADAQAPNLTKTFNIHAAEIVYNNFLPDWTVKEFIERFQNWKNVYFHYNKFTKTVTIESRQEPFTTATPNIIDLSTIADDTYIDTPQTTPNYNLIYDITDSDDETLTSPLFKTEKYLEDTNIQLTEIKNHFAPLIMSTEYQPTNGRTRGTSAITTNSSSTSWDWSINRGGSTTPTNTANTTVRSGILTTYQKGKSSMYGLNTEPAKSRALFCQVQNKLINTENVLLNSSLFITGTKGLYQTHWKTFFNAIANSEEVELKANLNKIITANFNYGTLFYYFNNFWIATQISYSNQTQLSKIKIIKINP